MSSVNTKRCFARGRVHELLARTRANQMGSLDAGVYSARFMQRRRENASFSLFIVDEVKQSGRREEPTPFRVGVQLEQFLEREGGWGLLCLGCILLPATGGRIAVAF